MATPDKNFRSYADESGVRIYGETIAPPDQTYADTLKFSNADDVEVEKCHVVGGYEDCVDINRDCEQVVLRNLTLEAHGEYAVTIKGGSHDIKLIDVVITAPGRVYDIDIGNWSDQNQNKTTSVKLVNVTRADGEKVRVRVLWADRPVIVGGNVSLTVVPRLAVLVYRFFRKLF
jgi:hypothetical protein